MGLLLIILGAILILVVAVVTGFVAYHIKLHKLIASIDPRDLEKYNVNRSQREVWIPEEDVREIKSE